MHLHSFRVFSPSGFFVSFLLLSIALSACGGVQTSPTTPTAPTANAMITWPFHPDNDQWAIVNAYRGNLDHAPGGSPNNYALFALDFAKCFSGNVNIGNGSCDLTNGWANTVGATVYAPVSGTIAWPDDNCLGASINIDGHPGFRVVLFHVDPLPGTTWSQLAHSNPPKHFNQGDKIGTVSAGGCIGSGNHIHMALYSCTECVGDDGSQRVGRPFSDQWSIGGCSLRDDGNTQNEYLGLLVPCHKIITTSPTSTPVQRTLTSQQTQSQTVNVTGQRTTPGTRAKGTLSFRNPYHGTPRGVPVTLDAGTVFDDDTNRTPNVQMMIDATITVPGDGTSVTVPAHVVPIGTIGNISQIRGWTHYGAYEDPVPLDIYNSTPFTGGTDPQTYTVVKQSDIDTAANSLQASTKQSAVADLNSQLHSNEHLVGDPQCTYNTTSDHAAGDQATTVTVTVKATCTATAST